VFGGTSASTRDRTMRTFLNIGLVKASNEKTRVPAAALVAARPKPAREPKVAAKVADVPVPQKVARPAADPTLAAGASEPQVRAQSQPIEMARVRSVLVAPRPAATTADRIEAEQARSQPEPPAPEKQWVTASTGGTRANAGSFHVQIGAFQSAAEAERHLAAVRVRAPAVLANRAPVTLQFRQGDKVLHRARFAGFDAQAAASTCSELKRLKVDCLVLKAD
jgi:D-alanyl-D-alanine carboxypeptidase